MNRSGNSEIAPCETVIDDSTAARALETLLNESVVGLDTETYWDHEAKRSRVALVQIATRAGAVFVIDALVVDPQRFRPLVESPQILMAAHNARFDQMVLANEGLRPAAFVDTLMMARRTLALMSYSLRAVAEHLLGVMLNKGLQKSNWLRRPLTPAQISYAALDAQVTLSVYDELKLILEGQGRWPEVLSASTLDLIDREAAPRRKRNAQTPLLPLTEKDKQVVTCLKRWRLEQSRAQRVPAYMICPDRTLEHLAHMLPETLAALRSIHGLGEAKIARYGESLLKALQSALA